MDQGFMPRARRLSSGVAELAALALAACATPFDNAPLNAPATKAFVTQSALPPPPDPRGGENLIALSLSGGGMRAAAFAFGVLQALQGGGPAAVDVEAALAAADTAVDSATRLGADTFARMVDEWRASIIRFRCALSPGQLRQHQRGSMSALCLAGTTPRRVVC